MNMRQVPCILGPCSKDLSVLYYVLYWDSIETIHNFWKIYIDIKMLFPYVPLLIFRLKSMLVLSSFFPFLLEYVEICIIFWRKTENLAWKGVLLPWKPKVCEKFVNFCENVRSGRILDDAHLVPRISAQNRHWKTKLCTFLLSHCNIVPISKFLFFFCSFHKPVRYVVIIYTEGMLAHQQTGNRIIRLLSFTFPPLFIYFLIKVYRLRRKTFLFLLCFLLLFLLLFFLIFLYSKFSPTVSPSFLNRSWSNLARW